MFVPYSSLAGGVARPLDGAPSLSSAVVLALRLVFDAFSLSKRTGAHWGALALVVLTLGLVNTSQAATYVVDNTGDTNLSACTAAAGDCTLRGAINSANSNPGADTINFAIPGGGVQTIQITSALPSLVGSNGAGTLIDGYSQSGASANTLATGSNAVINVQVKGYGTTVNNNNGFTMTAANCTLQGLSITNFLYGVYISSNLATGNKVTGNFIGVLADGTTQSANATGIYIDKALSTTVGGTSTGERNLISGNSNGVYITGTSATGNKVTGNSIGTNAAGTAAIANEYGVYIVNAPGNTVGGTTTGERNLISGNTTYGVHIAGGNASGNKVSGNYIGTNAAGTGQLANIYGVYIDGAPSNTVGGATTGERNVISGNTNSGIAIIVSGGAGSGATGNKVSGNYIGTTSDGTGQLANGNGVFIVSAPSNTIGGTTTGERNLISGNTCGVFIIGSSANGNKVSGNYIGTTADGTSQLANVYGVYLDRAPSNTVGGTSTGERNVISGNTNSGVFITGASAMGNKVNGNYIGTSADGTAQLSNGYGIFIVSAPSNTIGGTTSSERNLISGNFSAGVFISSGSGNKVSGNFIGTTPDGTAQLGNYNGVTIDTASSNVIGGTTSGERNIISGNTNYGVYLFGGTANRVVGNFIGTNVAGTAPIANNTGVYIGSAPSSIIGGINSGEGNLISGNTTNGVTIGSTSARGNQMRGNSIVGNGGLGIDLGGNGVTANDVGDVDTGANLSQNFPVLTSVLSSGGNTLVRGSLNSAASTTYTLDFYSNATADSSGYGEGETYLGSGNVTTDASGNATINLTLTGVTLANGLAISATATDPSGNTSEFSRDVTSNLTLSVGSASVTEGNTGTVALNFPVTLNVAPVQPVSVDYTTAGGTGTATAGTDYIAVAGTLTIMAGQTTGTISVTVNGDTVVEPDETITLTLSNVVGATLANTTATGTITNDDVAGPTITSFAPSSATAGTSVLITGTGFTGTTNVKFNGAAATYTVISATAIDAKVPVNTPISPGPITVTAPGGTATSASNFTFIVPSLNINSASVNEGNSGTTPMTFSVTLSQASGVDVTMDYMTTDGTATAPSDYLSTNGTLTIPAGQTLGMITVTVNGDTVAEPDETLSVSLSNPTNAMLGSSTVGMGTIVNDDTSVSLAVSPASVVEGDNFGNLVYTFTRAGVTSGALTVNFNVGGTATFGLDYNQTGAATFNDTSGTVTIPAGQTKATVTLTPFNDMMIEGNETAILTLSAGTGYSVGTPASATGTIIDDDADVTVAVAPASVLEDGNDNLVYTFTRSGATSQMLTVNFSVSGTATYNTDYYAFGAFNFNGSNGSVIFNAGATTATVTVDPIADTTAEPDETVTLLLGAGTNYNIGFNGNTATGTILNDDASPPTISSFTPTSGSAGTSVVITGTNFTGANSVKFNGVAATTYTVNSATQITVTVPAGATTGTISVTTPAGTGTSASNFTVTETASLIVTTTSDTSTSTDGVTSLREAIAYANSNAGADTITFAIPGNGVQIIQLASALPTITGANGAGTVINGTSQSGASVNTLATGNNAIIKVQIRGNGAANFDAFTIGAANCGVRGVSITNSRYGVYLNGASATGAQISGNFIGVAPDGITASANREGVFLNGAPNNTVGGTTAGERNVISGNSDTGVFALGGAATGNKISGNYIGTNASGTAAVVNLYGVYLNSASNTTIGGTTAGERNIISGNTNALLIGMAATAPTGNKILGNYIGLSADGTTAISNEACVSLSQASNTTIGGTTAGERNVLSGNTAYAIYVDESTGTKVTGNFIGTNAAGTTSIPNSTNASFAAVVLNNAVNTALGGVAVGEGNVISGNSKDGVTIQGDSSTGNSVRGNSIYNNGTTAAHLGIDLVGSDGVNANDAGDADTGPNELQNFPVLSSALNSGGNTVITGTLNSTANTTFTLDFYSNVTGDASGYGEGQTYLGSATTSTNASGNASFSATLTGVGVANGSAISATATNPGGSTSEFCQNVTSSLSQPASGSVVISEFRFSGPNGARDEYIELFNRTGNILDLSNCTLSAGSVTTPLAGLSLAGKTIPAYGHLLITNSGVNNSGGYSLGSTYPATYALGSTTPSTYATGDVQYTGDIALNSTLVLSGSSVIDQVGNVSGTAGLVSNSQYAFVRRMDGPVGRIDTDNDTNDFNLVDTASTKGASTSDGLSTLASGARLGAPGPQNAAAPNQRATLTLVPLDPASNQGIVPDGRYATRGTSLDPFGRLTLRRTITNYGSTTLKQIRFILVRTTAGNGTSSGAAQAAGMADLRAITSVGVSANGTKVVQAIQVEAPTTPTTPSNQLSSSDTGNGGGQNSSWNVGTLPNGGLLPGQSMNVEFVFGIVKEGNYNVSVIVQTAN